MAIKPILFNTEMVKAILDGRKTQTRRVAFKHDDLREFESNDYPDGWWYLGRVFKSFEDFLRNPQSPRCRYAPGDILWVQETWRPIEARSTGFCRIEYKAGGTEDFNKVIAVPKYQQPWKPSPQMPKEAARIFLCVKDVRLERLQNISEDGARAEGVTPLALSADPEETPDSERMWHEVGKARWSFCDLWDSTVKKADLPLYGWIANPWVWVIEFERCGKPEGWCT